MPARMRAALVAVLLPSVTVGAGTTTIHFADSQPWTGGTKAAWLVDRTVTAR